MKNCAAYAAKSLQENISLFIVSPAELMSKWVGESQKIVRCLYMLAEKHSPSLILYDEVNLCSVIQ
jgi:ATP-dependent 26S proteasome regulatory subunit